LVVAACQSRPGGASCRSIRVRNAPLATLGHRSATCRDGPQADTIVCIHCAGRGLFWHTQLMDCSSYLARIEFAGRPQTDLATLRRLQAGHLKHIAFENLDVQFGRRITLNHEDAFAKLVTNRRGGWCYEMNGLFRWALESIGFRVMPMAGAVMRRERGPMAIGNHLALIVELDEPYLVDVGLGDGPLEPIPLKEGSYQQQWRTLRLERLDDSWWRLHNNQNAFNPTLDFQYQPADWNLLASKCIWLQTSPESRLVQNAVCLRHLADGIVALVGRVLKTVGRDGVARRLVTSSDDYVATLDAVFGIRMPQAADLWPRIVRRHDVLFGSCDERARP
jgi:N-hydroxyarylamine O-acetyltransferase